MNGKIFEPITLGTFIFFCNIFFDPIDIRENLLWPFVGDESGCEILALAADDIGAEGGGGAGALGAALLGFNDSLLNNELDSTGFLEPKVSCTGLVINPL